MDWWNSTLVKEPDPILAPESPRLIAVESGGLYVVMDVTREGRVRLIHFDALPFDVAAYDPAAYHKYYTLLELHGIGEDIDDHHGSRHTYTGPAVRLRYVSHGLEPVPDGRILSIHLTDGALWVTVRWRFYDGAAVVRCETEVENRGETPFILDYITSFAWYGLSAGCQNWEDDSAFYIPHNTWHGELQWRKNTVWELGLSQLNKSSLKRLAYSQTGTWSSSEYLPMGVYENGPVGTCAYWQIEHNGFWYWECSDVPGCGLYLQLCGPTNEQSHFRKVLHKGESFLSVPVAAGVCRGGFDTAMGELTRYRRLMRRPHPDNEELPVVFNDYMNCLMGDPTTVQLLPLVEAAARIGCEYFVIDAGWFSEKEGGDDSWWSSVGIWKEASRRFPNGLNEVIDAIYAKGLLPGLWIEIEGIGPDSPLADTLLDDWFFQLEGRRVMEHYRYQLDFRNPEVRRFATGTLEEIVERYRLRYLKVDYNINAGIGTDFQADSPGSGLLEHNRAYLRWLDAFLDSHPDVVIENCASGGQRMDYAMLQRLTIQSTSDQTDYRQYAAISAMAPTAVTPEQAAVWSYPHWEGDEEETVFNMVNAMLGRVHQSGFLNRLPEANFKRVQEGIRCYKAIRTQIKTGLPIFPLGLARLRSAWVCGGLRCGRTLYVSVWRKDSPEDTMRIPLPCLRGEKAAVICRYPEGLPVSFVYEEKEAVLTVTLPRRMTARFFQITF